jgi:hypothetical protein
MEPYDDVTDFQVQMVLTRNTNVCVLVLVIAVFVFITSFVSYFVGLVAAVLAAYGAFITFHRCESRPALLYGITPLNQMCFQGCCGSPYSELYSIQTLIFVSMFFSLISAIVSLWAVIDRFVVVDWIHVMRILCCFFSVVLILASFLLLLTLRQAMAVFERLAVTQMDTDPSAMHERHVPRQQQPEPEYRQRAVVVNQRPPTASPVVITQSRGPQPVAGNWGDPYDNRSPQRQRSSSRRAAVERNQPPTFGGSPSPQPRSVGGGYPMSPQPVQPTGDTWTDNAASNPYDEGGGVIPRRQKRYQNTSVPHVNSRDPYNN